MLRILLLLVFSFANISVAQSSDPSNYNWHKVSAKTGDGVFSLLRRYQLSAHACNIAKFYALNKMDKDAALHEGQKYMIPVIIYQYNGKSIRSTIGIDDWDKAVRIQEYNESILKAKLRRTKYTESRILWVPFHEIGCENNAESEIKDSTSSPIIPEDKSSDTEEIDLTEGRTFVPLFGKKYSEVIVADTRLSDKVFYLVAGHGGPDPGALCKNCHNTTLCEDEYAYDVTLRLARNLKQHGAIVHIIVQDANDGIRDDELLKCDTDETCLNSGKIPVNQVKRLRQRANTINNLFVHYKQKGIKEQIALIIHVDSRNKKRRQDVFFYHNKHSKSGKELAQNLLKTFDRKYAIHQKNRDYKGFVRHRNLYMLNYTYPTAVFVELANIQNKSDHRRLLIPTNRQALANWLFEGMLKSLDLSQH